MSLSQVKEKKAEKVKKIKEKMESSKILILTDYRGMTVKEITELRRRLRGCRAEYRVLKNTLASRALPEKNVLIKDKLSGTVAIIFGYDDVVAPAKTLAHFMKETEKPKILGGVLDGQYFEEKAIAQLAKLKSREGIIADVVGGFKSPLFRLVNALQGNLRKMVYVLNALKDKKSQAPIDTGQGGE